MRPSSIATRYAQAAFEVAEKDGDVEGWLRELLEANDAVQDREVAEYFKDPSSSMEQQLDTLSRLTNNVRPHVLNLLRALVSRHRLHLLPAVVREFESLNRQARGIEEAYVTVARALTEDEIKGVGEGLSTMTGKTIEVYTQVDPSILGGIVVRIGDRLYDASIVGRLERLRQTIAV